MATRYGLDDPEPTGRPGWIAGQSLIEFRLTGTGELLWEAPMFAPPQVDDVVPSAIGTAALTDYTVLGVRREFREVVTPGTVEEPEEVPIEGALSYCRYIVTVKLGL